MATTAARAEIRLLWALDARQVIKRLIVDRRERLGLTQEQVSERARQPLRSYQRWEAGEVLPRKTARKAVALALELEPDALEPPQEPKDPDGDHDVHAALQEVLARLTRIEAALATPQKRAASTAKRQAARTRAQLRAVRRDPDDPDSDTQGP